MSMDFGKRGVILALRGVRRLIRKPYIHSSVESNHEQGRGTNHS